MLVMRASRRCDVLQWMRSAIWLVLGIAGTRFVSNYNPSDNIGASAPAVCDRIVEQNELVFVSQDYGAADSRVMPRRSSACSTFRLLTTASDIATRGRSRMALTSRLPRLTPRGTVCQSCLTPFTSSPTSPTWRHPECSRSATVRLIPSGREMLMSSNVCMPNGARQMPLRAVSSRASRRRS